MADDRDPERTRVTPVDPLVGTELDGRYRIDFQLASGGFGAVYHATHAVHGREVAIKVLHPKFTRDPAVVARFRREAAALGRLRTPHAITLYDFGEAEGGMLYIVMELLSGESLYEVFRSRGPLPWRRVVAIARQVCDALAEAHARGIVHRDLKPSNIHLEKRGGQSDFVKVLDFGIAKILQGGGSEPDGITRTGQMIGTFDYMAPEQMVGGACSARSDLFTLGIVIYEMIAGERPYGERRTSAARLSALLTDAPPPLSSRSNAPRALDSIVARCLDREVELRYGAAAELAAALDGVLADSDDNERTVTRKRAPVEAGDDETWIDEAPPGPRNIRTTLRGVLPPRRRR